MRKSEAERSRFIGAVAQRGNGDRSSSQHPLFENHISTNTATQDVLCLSSFPWRLFELKIAIHLST